MQRGDILRADLGLPPGGSGHEQAGVRPVIAVSLCDEDPGNPLITVIPLTSKRNKANYPHTFEVDPTEGNGLTEISVVMAFQIVSLDRRRIIKVIGKLDPKYMKQLEEVLRSLLSL